MSMMLHPTRKDGGKGGITSSSPVHESFPNPGIEGRETRATSVLVVLDLLVARNVVTLKRTDIYSIINYICTF